MDCGSLAFSQAMVCPACETSLTQRDDIVVSELNPTEDYKSSVISGLRPDLIIEIVGRAISFWMYQVSQEAAYQAMVRKDLDDQCSKLERQLQSLVREANQEIAALQESLSSTVKTNELEKRRHHELAEQFAEKTRQFQKLQALYDKLKRKSLVAQQKDGHSTAIPADLTPSSNFNYSQHPPHFGNAKLSTLASKNVRAPFGDHQKFIGAPFQQEDLRISTPLPFPETDKDSSFRFQQQQSMLGSKFFTRQSGVISNLSNQRKSSGRESTSHFILSLQPQKGQQASLYHSRRFKPSTTAQSFSEDPARSVVNESPSGSHTRSH
ncbi:hypothetical protein BDV3_005041 [Batrachochytrium dendrobatidis]|nr:hypothetical protein QVD99_002534 [Batrachochytrium dendrobatidis]